MGLLDWLFGSDERKEVRKRVFVSFAIEDRQYRDHLIDQAKGGRAPFEFIDMSVKKRWREHEWRQKCRTKIRRCHGVIALLSEHTMRASGARWEMKCAREERIPIVGMHIKKNDRGPIPPELKGKRVMTWTWPNIQSFLAQL